MIQTDKNPLPPVNTELSLEFLAFADHDSLASEVVNPTLSPESSLGVESAQPQKHSEVSRHFPGGLEHECCNH